MSKKAFAKLLMIVGGAMSFILGIIVASEQTGLLHWIGVVALAAGVILLLIGIFTPKAGIDKEKITRVLWVLLASAVLHGLGIVLMIYVHWMAGLPLVLLGLLTLLFLIPAIRGFQDGKRH